MNEYFLYKLLCREKGRKIILKIEREGNDVEMEKRKWDDGRKYIK
jgi:hypothetical protein